jgi:hypothetical protein
MKFIDLKFNADDLKRLATVLSSDNAEARRLLNDPSKLLKGHEVSHKSVLESEIRKNNILIDYIKSKEELLKL